MSTGTAHKSVNRRFIRFIIHTFGKKQIFDRWPRTPEQCAVMSAAFATTHAAVSGGVHVLRGCIGALDGTLVPIWISDYMQKLYYCRKGPYALLLSGGP